MTPYISVACALFMLALVEVGAPPKRRLWGTIALLIVLAFGVLRFETGFDWAPYAKEFDDIPPIAVAIEDGIQEPYIPMETLFIWLNVVVKTFTEDVTVLFVVVALFGIVSIHEVSGKISRSQCLMWLVYFCLAFLPAQMSSIRAAITASLVLIGLALAAREKPIRGLAVIAVAVGFHTFSAAFLALPLLRKTRPPIRGLLVPVLTFGFICMLLGVQAADQLIDLARPFLPGLASEKLALFYQGVNAPVSKATLVLIVGHLTLLYLLCTDRNATHDPFIIIAIWLVFMVLMAHLFLSGLPAIWNRIMYVSLPWEIACLGRIDAFVRLGMAMKRTIILGIGAMSVFGLVYFLVSPASLPFVPYQSIIEVWLTGDYGDGPERSYAWYTIYREGL
ncbi:MAG TPA: EpsG family protein [Candidatus Acidoferrum sp.]|jgi:hypothetical protein|nr:EpsG family protein [Candidatus Acidoferrum sp.]